MIDQKMITPDYYVGKDGKQMIQAYYEKHGEVATFYACHFNAEKYINRAGKKAYNSAEQDMMKADRYIGFISKYVKTFTPEMNDMMLALLTDFIKKRKELKSCMS